MIAALLAALITVLAPAHATPGRTHAGLSVGAAVPDLFTEATPVVWGSLDYGVVRRFALTGEAGLGGRGGAVAGGLLFEPVDTKWWRVGVAAMPELGFGTVRLIHVQRKDLELRGRVGLRVDWLAFWGLSFTARADHVFPLGSAGWTELGAGLAVRL